jgi:hypothetical protein
MTDDITADRLAAIEALLAAATPGPWESKWHEVASEVSETVVASATGEEVIGIGYYDGLHVACKEADALFIAHARQDVPSLVECVRSLDLSRKRHMLCAEHMQQMALGAFRERDAALSLLRVMVDPSCVTCATVLDVVWDPRRDDPPYCTECGLPDDDARVAWDAGKKDRLRALALLEATDGEG